MSQSNNMPNSISYPIRVQRILFIIFGILTLVMIPLLGYFVGQFVGIHMATGDVYQGYAYSGLLYTVYNATHNPVYLQESQVSQSMGIAQGQSDSSDLPLFGLAGGFLADFPIGVVFVREYERMDS